MSTDSPRKLLSCDELGAMVPLFRGRWGQRLAALALKITGVDQINSLYDRAADSEGAAFAGRMIDELRLDCQIGHAERLDSLPDGAFITISNHPYGSIDGIMLTYLIGSRRTDFKVMANQILARIKPLAPSFITVHPTGNTKQAVNATNLAGVRTVLTHLQEGHPVGFFPSGAVSDYHPRTHDLSDREWQESLIRLIQRAGVPVVPIRFFDRNSRFFYFLGLINWKIRVLRLPREVLWQRGRRQRIAIGETIPPEQLQRFTTSGELRDFLRASVYGMPLPDTFTSLHTDDKSCDAG